MKMTKQALLLTLALGGGFSFAEGEVKEAAKEVKADVKKGVRAAKDEACPLVDGKVQCAGKKLKHKVENATDKK